MILRPEQIRLLRLGCPAIPANGGDSDSQANTTNNTTNTNHINTEDRRVVASDAAVGVSGNGNVTSRTESTSFTDASDRSTSFTDASDRSTHITTTDFGSVTKSLEGLTTMGLAAVDLGDTSVTGAIDALKRIADNNLAVTTKALDLARYSSADSARTVETVSAFANKQTALTNAAFESSAFGPDLTKNVMWVALAAVAAIALPAIFKKG